MPRGSSPTPRNAPASHTGTPGISSRTGKRSSACRSSRRPRAAARALRPWASGCSGPANAPRRASSPSSRTSPRSSPTRSTNRSRSLTGLVVHASHDFAIAGLRDLSASTRAAIGLQYKGSFDALASLRRGECDLAGFHVPEGPLGALMTRRYSECLPPEGYRLIKFVTRAQGLIVRAGNPKSIRASRRPLPPRRSHGQPPAGVGHARAAGIHDLLPRPRPLAHAGLRHRGDHARRRGRAHRGQPGRCRIRCAGRRRAISPRLPAAVPRALPARLPRRGLRHPTDARDWSPRSRATNSARWSLRSQATMRAMRARCSRDSSRRRPIPAPDTREGRARARRLPRGAGARRRRASLARIHRRCRAARSRFPIASSACTPRARPPPCSSSRSRPTRSSAGRAHFRDDETAWVPKKYAELPELGRLTGRGNTANVEVVLKAKPDLIVDIGSTSATFASLADRVQSQTGIPYVLLDGRLETTPQQIEKLADRARRAERGRELAGYATRLIDELQEKIAAMPADKRPEVYYARGPQGLQTGPRGLDQRGDDRVPRREERGGRRTRRPHQRGARAGRAVGSAR